MTIVMIGQKGLPARSGGIERHVSLLASGLASRGHRIIVYGRKWYAGVGAIPVGVEQKFSSGIHTKHLDALTHTITALFAARADQPNVIHVHGSGIEILIPLARLLHPRAKIVYTFHSRNDSLSKWNRFARFGLRVSTWIGCHTAHQTVVVSQALARHCLETYDCQATYIAHPFHTSRVSAAAAEDFLREERLTSNKYLLFVGRLIPDKQAHVLIEAYAAARKSDPERLRNIPLVIVGAASWTDAYARWLAHLAASVPGVKLLGERCGHELTALQTHALAHAFPTASEGLSIAMLEAASLGRPIVMTDLPQNIEATGGHAIAVPTNSVEQMTAGLLHVLRLSDAERVAMGRKAAEHVRTQFATADRLDDMDRLYRSLVKGVDTLTSPVQLGAAHA